MLVHTNIASKQIMNKTYAIVGASSGIGQQVAGYLHHMNAPLGKVVTPAIYTQRVERCMTNKM